MKGDKSFSMVEIGQILDGKVTGLTDFGAFILLPDGSTGMVHISEVASAFVKNIRDHLTENQEVKVKVLEINEKGKISLSIKKAMEPENAERVNRPDRFEKQDRPKKPYRSAQKGWQGIPQKHDDNMSFEDMMSSFKKLSDEKMGDLKKTTDNKRGTRRGGGPKG